MNNVDKILELMRAQAKCIWINTYEEKEAIQDIRKASLKLKKPMSVYSHSFSMGTQKCKLTNGTLSSQDKTLNTENLLNSIYNKVNNITADETEIEDALENGEMVIEDDNNIIILKDFHLMIENAHIKRMIRDIVESRYINYNCIVIVSPLISIPLEHEKAFSLIDYDTPDEEMIRIIFNKLEESASLKVSGYIKATKEESEAIINACKGLTIEEIRYIFKLSTIRNKAVRLSEVANYKIELIKKSNILDYKIPDVNLKEIGGNDAFKKWADEAIDSMSDDAKLFGCENPKGYLALGVPGTAKTLLAEAMANKMNVPFLKLDMSRILDSKVGNSEKNMYQAIRMIKATAPCVLLIDEVEKTLSDNDGNSDGGTMQRALGAILEFLASDHGVYVIMTSNDVSRLPAELTRAGRMDAIWYFGLPTLEERIEIFRIHFAKANREINNKLLVKAGEYSHGFTGAEIKEAVKGSLRKAFYRYKKDNNREIINSDIFEACSEIIPVSKSSREKITFLEEYAKTRARFSNKAKEIQDKRFNLLSIADLK